MASAEIVRRPLSFVRELVLGLHLLWRDQRAGELTLIAAAIVIAVASVTTIGFFADRVQHALGRQANQLLGADLVIVSDRPIAGALENEARGRGLSVSRMLRFPSMAMRGERNTLSSIKVVTEGYPLRGEVRLAEAPYGVERPAGGIPAPGTAWIDDRLASQLGLARGERFELGRMTFSVAAIVTHEPDAGIGFISSAPRVIINEADIDSTGLVQPGSRIAYRLLVAGPAQGIDEYRSWAAKQLAAGQRIEGIRDARPEIRSALDRAEKFLSLTALVSVILAAVAIGLASRRFLQRHLDACAIMRCFGASHASLVRLYLVQFGLLGLIASAIGCALGVAAQAALAYWLGNIVAVELPAPGMLPALHGLVIGLALLLGFALPPLAALARVPTLRVLRRDIGAPASSGFFSYAIGIAVIASMILWKAQGVRLGGMVMGGFAAAILVSGVLTWLLLRMVSAVRGGGVTWRYGVANLRRRALGSVLQVIALAMGMMALLVLTLVRADLLNTWRTTLPADAPNRFIVNIQPDQVERLRAFFDRHHVTQPELFPMVRARLVQINDRRVSSANYADEQARRLIDREFNLSWAERLQSDNNVSAGHWWNAKDSTAQFSVEDGIAERLGIHLNDRLTFDIAGETITAPVTSLRKVDWDSFNVNFFVVAPPGVLERYPTTFVTSFYLPSANSPLLASLVRDFPNLLLIDVAQIMSQVQTMMDQVVRAVQFIFLFTLLAGLTVLYAAIASTQDERLYQATVMRTLGASRAQLRRAIVAEFAVLGLLSGTLAAAGASALAFFVATRILNLPYTPSPTVWLTGAIAGTIGIALAGYAGTRAVLNVAPLKAMRDLA